MSVHSTEALVRRLFEEAWNANNKEAIREIISDQYTSSENQIFASSGGHAVFTADLELYHGLYRNLTFDIKQILTHGNTTVVVWTASGTANNEFFTNRAGQQTNKSLQADGVSLVKTKDGKITEAALYWPRRPLFP